MVSKKSVYKKSKKSKTLKRKHIPKSRRKSSIKKGGMNFEDDGKSINSDFNSDSNSDSTSRNSKIDSLGSFGDLGSMTMSPSIYHSPKTSRSLTSIYSRTPPPVVVSKASNFDPNYEKPPRNRFLKESISPIPNRSSPAKRIRSLDDEEGGYLTHNWSMGSLEGLKTLDGWETIHTIEGLTIYKKISNKETPENIHLQLESPNAIVSNFKKSAEYDNIINVNNKILDDIQEQTGKREFPKKLEEGWESYITIEGITIYYKIHDKYNSIIQISTIHPTYIGNPEFVLKL